MQYKTIEYMIDHAGNLLARDPQMYQQLIRSFQTMSWGGDAGQTEAWSMYTMRGEYYPNWSDDDFIQVLSALGELVPA